MEYNKEAKLEAIRKLVHDCYISNNGNMLAELIFKLEHDYVELAELSTDGAYNRNWTHEEVLDYLTYS
ncbi:MAG: hypothetical protein EBU90_14440 [Proteobacteria bacterium]|nr:hypothetical protein [Pseudomonadota bacterium]NBP15376.1 hypothetical protein [bacterium]